MLFIFSSDLKAEGQHCSDRLSSAPPVPSSGLSREQGARAKSKNQQKNKCCAGGHLQLVSMPGYGTDAFLNLKRLEGDWQEDHAEPAESLLIQEDGSESQK